MKYRKLIVVLLTVIMMMTSMPAMVFAADETDDTQEQTVLKDSEPKTEMDENGSTDNDTGSGDAGRLGTLGNDDTEKSLVVFFDLGSKGKEYNNAIVENINSCASWDTYVTYGVSAVIISQEPGVKITVTNSHMPINKMIGLLQDAISNTSGLTDKEGCTAMVRTKSKMSDYTESTINEDIYDEDPISDGKTFFLLWNEMIKEVDVTVDQPKCGTKVTVSFPGEIPIYFTPSLEPSIRVSSKSHCELSEYGYYGPGKYWEGFNGTSYTYNPKDLSSVRNAMVLAYSGIFQAGKKYYASFYLTPKFGYYFSKALVVRVNGKTLARYEHQAIMPLEPVDETVTWEIKEEWSFDHDNYSIEVAAGVTAAHDWGAWTVTRKPTTKKEGEEMRTCKNCGATETRPIPKLVEDGSRSKSPKTSDSAHLAIWMMVMFMATAMLACTMTIRIRQRNRRS